MIDVGRSLEERRGLAGHGSGEGGEGRVGEPRGLRGWLREYGDRMSDKEVSLPVFLRLPYIPPWRIQNRIMPQPS